MRIRTSPYASPQAHNRPSTELCGFWALWPSPFFSPKITLLRAVLRLWAACAQHQRRPEGHPSPGPTLCQRAPHSASGPRCPSGEGSLTLLPAADPGPTHAPPLQRIVLGGAEELPCHLLPRLPLALFLLNTPPAPPPWPPPCPFQFLTQHSRAGRLERGSQLLLTGHSPHSRPMPQGAVGTCRWCRGPCRT